MRAWKVVTVPGKPIDLEIALNKQQNNGFEIFDIINGSFGYTLILYMDAPVVSVDV